MARLIAFLALACVLATMTSAKLFVASPAPRPPHQHGDIFMLVHRLAEAIAHRDFTEINNLIDDNAEIRITDQGCGWTNKTTFVEGLRTDNVAAELFLTQTSVESGNAGLFSNEVIATFDAKSNLANYTSYRGHAIIFAAPNSDKSKIMVLQQFTDRSWAQSNASAMVDVFMTLRNASGNGDIAPWQSLLTQDFMYQQFEADAPTAPTPINRTAFLGDLEATYSSQVYSRTFINTAFAACDYVAAEFGWAGAMKDGRRMVNKFLLGMRLNSQFMVNEMSEWVVVPFDRKK